MFKCDKCGKQCKAKQDLDNHQKALGHTGTRSPVVFVPAGWSTGRNSRSSGRNSGSTGSWNVNGLTGQMMDMQLDQNWALCGKDCTWCGHCAESYGY
jgi:hypothetical protein